jgi:hypothetical protein
MKRMINAPYHFDKQNRMDESTTPPDDARTKSEQSPGKTVP